MAKVPVAGRVKTRLAREIGVAHGHALCPACHGRPAGARRVRCALERRSCGRRPTSAHSRRIWPRAIARVPQGRGDLGQRMQRIMDRTAAGPVVIIGTDVPASRPAISRRLFAQLGRHDAVFGPATDGGYWLVGLRRRPRVLQLLRRCALVEPACAGRHAGQSRGPHGCDAGDPRRCRRCGDLDLLTAGDFGRRVLPR